MVQEDFFLLGYIASPHGYKGAINLLVKAEGFNSKKIKKVFLGLNGSLVPFFVQKLERKNNDKYILYLEGVSTEAQVTALLKKEVFISNEDVIQTQKNIFQPHDLVGFEVFNQENEPIGEITDVFETAAHPLVQVFHQNRQILIPIHPDLIIKMDTKSRKILLNIPEGILAV